MTAMGVIAIVTCLVAGGIYVKTKRIGPTVGAVIGGAVVTAAKDVAVIQSLGHAVGSIFVTFGDALPGWLSNGG